MTQSNHAPSLNQHLVHAVPATDPSGPTRANVWTTLKITTRRAHQSLQRWRRNRAASQHLSKLPDELLDDVGLNRMDVLDQLNRPLLSYWRDDEAQ
ncbi:MAG: DUF1127 domain-containing protein [Natronospirillum sp.]